MASDVLIHDFETDCYARGLTHRTVQTYRCNIRTFLEENPDPYRVKKKDLKEYLLDLRYHKRKPSTINGHFSAISSFYDYLAFEKEDIVNPIPPFRRRYIKNKRVFNDMDDRQLIDIETMQQLITLPFEIPEHTHIREYIWTVPIRDVALMMTFAKTGTRREENRSIELDEINRKTQEIHIKPFAKRTNCLVFMDHELQIVLEEYLKWRNQVAKNNNPWLWQTHTGHRLRKDDIYYIVTFYAYQLGIHNPDGPLVEKFTPYCFRHWFTTWLRRRGMSREHRKWLRGDAPDGADDLYDHIDVEDVREEYLLTIPELL